MENASTGVLTQCQQHRMLLLEDTVMSTFISLSLVIKRAMLLI